jgi:hypothetical protein
VLAQQAVHAHGARHEPNHVRPPPANQTPKTASPPLPPCPPDSPGPIYGSHPQRPRQPDGEWQE